MICPHCKKEIEEKPAPLIKIRGKEYRVEKFSGIHSRIIGRDRKGYSMYTLPVPILVVKS